ncbi:hypothetical protein DPMN_046701 [Dreissena polymorpha]|uniref:Uncharacterized protein n=1 Tax=Dreissena polymorpha TaxID=45954 RepID=A0A9D4I2G2_DREPO|nr:hypothetical protein DPMN_046701 [Dreissena polymorpha]
MMYTKALTIANKGSLFRALSPLSEAVFQYLLKLNKEHRLAGADRSSIFFLKIWEKYEDDDITTTELLRACSHIIGLGPSTTMDKIHIDDF